MSIQFQGGRDGLTTYSSFLNQMFIILKVVNDLSSSLEKGENQIFKLRKLLSLILNYSLYSPVDHYPRCGDFFLSISNRLILLIELCGDYSTENYLSGHMNK